LYVISRAQKERGSLGIVHDAVALDTAWTHAMLQYLHTAMVEVEGVNPNAKFIGPITLVLVQLHSKVST
jgi:hypothetical protein